MRPSPLSSDRDRDGRRSRRRPGCGGGRGRPGRGRPTFPFAGFTRCRHEGENPVGCADAARPVVAGAGEAGEGRGAAGFRLFGGRAGGEPGFFVERRAAFAVGADRHVVQPGGRVEQRAVERPGGVGHAARAAGEGEHGGDDRRGEAGAAVGAPFRDRVDHAPFFIDLFAFFTRQVRVPDHHTRVRIGIGGDVVGGARGAAADRAPVGHFVLPGRCGEDGAAATTGRSRAVPDALALPAAADPQRVQPGTADGDDVRVRCGEAREFSFAAVPFAVAAVAGRGGDHRAGVVEGFPFAGTGEFLGRAPGVRDLLCAQQHRAPLCRREVAAGGVGRLHQQDLAALADRMSGLDVERDLRAPADRFFRFCAVRIQCLWRRPGVPRARSGRAVRLQSRSARPS